MIFLLKKIYKLFKKKIYFNIFNTSYKKNVLISYITNPLKYKNNYYHTNTQECLVICNIFKKKKYNVDLCNFDYKKKLNYEKYDLVFGFGIQLSYFKKNSKNNLTIYYSTGLYNPLNDLQSLKKLHKYYSNNSELIQSLRLSYQNYFNEDKDADYIIYLDNWKNELIYKNIFKKKIYKVNTTFNHYHNRKKIVNLIEKKDLTLSTKSFIYYQGPGAIHKGLDILINFFTKNKDLELNIFCSFKNEERFFKINKKLFKNNIKYHGEIDINSKIFLKTLNKSMFSIQASVGEGQSSSIVNTTSLGLMPVLSRKSGQRFKFKYIEIDIDNNSKLELQIKNLLKIPINKLRSEVIDNTGICFKYYSIKNYDTKMMENLSLILKNIK
jgi:hypothetical protein